MTRDGFRSSGGRLAPGSVLTLLLVGVVLGAAATLGLKTQSVNAAGAGAGLPPYESPFVRVAEQVLPGVVSVEARRLFQHPVVEEDSTRSEDMPPEGPIMVPSSGSGFIIDDEGHVLTNNHVVAGAASLSIRLASGQRLVATIVGTDPQTDVAVLKVKSTEPLPVVPLGDSDALKIGEWVAAVGNPLGVLEGTLTVGVVSAKKRNEIEISGSSPSYQDFIQTDAAINFGNSGGPLVNTRGEAVGINTAFGGPGKGIGFAVSINMAKEVARSLIEEGKVKRGFLGVVLQHLDRALAKGLGARDAQGVLLRDVTPRLPADLAGLRAGDVILSFDGLPVRSVADFRLQVARTPIGSQVAVRYLRRGQEESTHVQLAERPDSDLAEVAPAAPPSPTALGLVLAVAPSESPSSAGGGSAIVVTAAPDSGMAAAAGLDVGDLILEVDGSAALNPDQCLAAILGDQKASRPAVLRVQRGGEKWYVALPFGEDFIEEPYDER